jgi:alpha-tubulin suppressor-like RCC1 family protein
VRNTAVCTESCRVGVNGALRGCCLDPYSATIAVMRLVAILALLSAGCIGPVPFLCTDDTKCPGGQCEPNGYCSFPDESCTSARRYGTHAPEEISDTCVKDCIRDIALGDTHGCLRTEEGAIWCWGNGFQAPTPLPVGDARQIAAGGTQTCAIVGDAGVVQCWGSEAPGDLHGAVHVALGKNHGCALLTDGSVVCWGTVGFQNASALGAGGSSTCALAVDGLYCWGDNQCGQLGLASAEMYAEPTKTELELSGAPVLGASHACGIHNDDVVCWGDTDDAMGCSMRVVDPTPLQAEQRPSPRVLAAGRAHSCVLYETEAIACWGDAAKGQLGPALFGGMAHSELTAINVALPPARAIAAGGDTSCAVTKTGRVLCWGDGAQGQLGTLDVPVSAEPLDKVSDSVLCP